MGDENRYDELDKMVEWHCPGRHGVIRNISKETATKVMRELAYFFGSKANDGQWWIQNPDGTYSVEFTHQTKVFPPPKKPWEWCGTSVLFAKQAELEEIRKQMKTFFKIGMKVRFVFSKKGKADEVLVGYICNKASRATVVIPGSETIYYIPYGDLEIVED